MNYPVTKVWLVYIVPSARSGHSPYIGSCTPLAHLQTGLDDVDWVGEDPGGDAREAARHQDPEGRDLAARGRARPRRQLIREEVGREGRDLKRREADMGF